ncbi:MAG: SAM-dependent methyltransferase [Candidatus Nitrospira kreftii]|uniref:SAM-dependent methyltransferase n=1 Tax=Candidatus Nitrospira kreftii TaxID=2652173 RepID=A0A7S8IYZ2_9BACT|nr:MAG: SAM-dependent methyltransferase [Candidatus Nitrospira kreftii]
MSGRYVSWEEAVAWLATQPDKQELVRDCYFDSSPEDAAERYSRSDEWKAIVVWLPSSPGLALDVGAGRGIASYALAKAGWTVVAIEPDSSNFVGRGAIQSIAQSKRLPIEVVEEFGERLPRESASFDLVLARQVLHHARDLNVLCAEVFRVLKPGGRFIAVRDHVITSLDDLPSFLQDHPLHQLYGGEHAYQSSQYLDALRSAGFRVEQIFRSFDSVINYAPHTRDSLRNELQRRLDRLPLGSLAGRCLYLDPILDLALAILSRVDQRPGRLYSFICSKPWQ